MDRATKVIILIGCILLFIACIYPPYVLWVWSQQITAYLDTGYTFLSSIGMVKKYELAIHYKVVHWEKLALEIMAIIALTVGLIMLVKIFKRNGKG